MTIAPLQPIPQIAGPVRPDGEPAAGVVPSAPSMPAQAATPILNPDPVIDASLGIVVLQYFSQAGAITQTFPSRRQLDQYQIYGLKDQKLPGPD